MNNLFPGLPLQGGTLYQIVFLIFIVWSYVWKGIALWKSSRNNQKFWFIAILIINSVGILEIVYLGFFQKDKNKMLKKKRSEVL